MPRCIAQTDPAPVPRPSAGLRLSLNRRNSMHGIIYLVGLVVVVLFVLSLIGIA